MTPKETHEHRMPETAGHCMTTSVPLVHENLTIKNVHDLLSRDISSYETINYVYVQDSNNRLVGVLSVREIFSLPKETLVGTASRREKLVYVHPDTHQERAANSALKYNLKAIPVVDRDMKFLGEITADSILSILYKEMHEDSLRRAGIRHSGRMGTNVLTLPLLSSIRHRLPWLLLGLIGGLLAAKVIGFFEQTLSTNLILAAFIPLVVYMSGAVGTQMEAYIIRDLAIQKSLPFWHYLGRHLLVVIAIGAALVGVLVPSYAILYGDMYMASVLGLSLFAVTVSSVLTGLMIPYAFSRISLDPADASGPVATIIQDILSILIYFSIAQALL